MTDSQSPKKEELDPEFGDVNLDEDKKKELKKIMAKEAKAWRELTGTWRYLFNILSLVMVLFYFYGAGIKPITLQWSLGLYVALTFVMVFLCFPLWSRSNKSRPTFLDILLALGSAFTVGYWIFEYEALNYRAGSFTTLDIAVSIAGLLISLEVCRRVLGWSLALTGIFFIAYGFLGPYFPDLFAHRGFSLERLSTTLFLDQNGMFGVMASVLVNYVILFIFFGAFLQKSGVGKFFIDWPMALVGRSVGGPAKVAVVASAFFGSVSGSAIANTVSTGAFTIPLMKKAGFRPHVAGAIEPAASIGGMFMPPIMGAGGFLMAELTGIPYVDIMKMAIFPALLYFFSVFCMIHFEAKKMNIKGLDMTDMPAASVIFKKHWYKSAPLIIIVIMMLLGYSAGNAAFWATLSCIAISQFDREYRMGPRQIWEALIQGSRSTLVIGATVGVIGIIVGTIALSGIGLKFSDIIFSMSGGNLHLAIVLIGIASLILGMGVPVTAAYLITAVLAVPVLSQMMITGGFHVETISALIAAHTIVYWFSQDSNITPPVCVAAYAGAAIAGSDPWKTGWTSFKYAKLLYVVPFLCAYDPAFLLYGNLYEIGHAFVSAIIGTFCFSAISMGFFIRRLNVVQWILGALATLMCYHTGYWTNFVGLVIFALIWFWQSQQNKRELKAKPVSV